jgi:hypothetical protein
MSAIAEPTLPLVKSLSSEQRQALMVELVKAWFDDAGWPAPFVVRDGETVLGIFKPEWNRPNNTSIPDFPAEFVEEMTRRHQEIVEGRAELLTTDEFLGLVKSELDRTPHE